VLVARAGSGDARAVHGLIERFMPDLERFVDRHAGLALRQRESPSDLVQSACREVLEDLAGGRFEYRGETEFRSWLFTMALRKVQQKGRFHAADCRALAAEVEASPSRADRLFQTLHTPSRSAEDREERRRFAEAFARLDAAQQNLIVWAHLDGWSHRRIAAHLGVSEGNSRVMLARALSRLARLATRGA
jgi:RNA polymerase sigma-70 factor (ECF subfamily)